MRTAPLVLLLLGAAPLLSFQPGCGPPKGEAIQVFAAASLRPVVEPAVAELAAAGGTAFTVSFASSSTLARQIEAGAPADVYLSANTDWIDWLGERKRLVDGARVALASNALVLIAPKGEGFSWAPGEPLPAAFEGQLSLGEPSHVPAGIYAREALEKLGAWKAVEPRVVGAGDVRAALRFVATGGAAAGIVYNTDARDSDEVTVVARLTADLHTPIRYVGAPVRGGSDSGARRLLDFLASERGQQIFADHGFLPPPGPAR